MLVSMGGLSIGSLLSGFMFKDVFIGMGTCAFTGSIYTSPSHAYEFGAEFLPYATKSLPMIFSFTGTILALVIYAQCGVLISRMWLSLRGPLLLLGKRWYFDSLYNRLFAVPALKSGYSIFFAIIDKGILERVGPTGISKSSFAVSTLVTRLQSGYIHAYMTLAIASALLLATLT